ncbi:unnamed protein product [Ixodes pacificus]
MLRPNAILLVSLYVVLFGSTFITNKYVLTIEKFAYPAIFQRLQSSTSGKIFHFLALLDHIRHY